MNRLEHCLANLAHPDPGTTLEQVTEILGGLATLAHDYQPADSHDEHIELEAKLKTMVDAIAGDSLPG